MELPDLPMLIWHKSSRSVTRTYDAVAVRDSKDPDGPALLVSCASFARFLDSVR